MRKLFEYIGLITLMCFSFFITEKTTMIAKNMDNIMVEIKSNYQKFEFQPKDATINNDEIIPGICGKKVNINKSYNEMKKIGMYDEKLYQYNYQNPNQNLLNNYDKYVIKGNSFKNYIYFFITITNSNIFYLQEYDFKNYNFIMTYDIYIKNKKIVEQLIDNGNSILLENTSFKKYKKISKDYENKTGNKIFCYNEKKDSDFLDLCSSNKSNTISGIYYIDNNYFLNLKKNLSKGNFVHFELSKELLVNIKYMEDYVEQKGITKSNIDYSLKECN